MIYSKVIELYIHIFLFNIHYGLSPASLVAQMLKKSACNAGDPGSIPELRRSPGEGKWLPTPIFLPVILPTPKEPDGLQSMGSQRVTQLSN